MSVEQPAAETLAGEPGEPSVAVRGRVTAARERAAERQGGVPNGELDAAALRRHARLTRAGRQELARGYRALGLSGRGHDRVLRVARTIADLADCDQVDADHIAGALAMRRKGQR